MLGTKTINLKERLASNGCFFLKCGDHVLIHEQGGFINSLLSYFRKLNYSVSFSWIMGENNLPPGFRFHPTDEELISCYLTNKLSDFNFTSRAIVDVHINKFEPWDLPGKASMGKKEWYFFNLRDRKYPTSLRTNRATEAGYWKTTGRDKEIFKGDALVGMKKTLVFYKGRAPRGERTNWVMHEYRLENKLSFKTTTKEEWVVCRVFKKSICMKKLEDQSPPIFSHPSLNSPCDTNPISNAFGDFEFLPNLNSPSSITHTSMQNHNFHYNASMNMNWPTPNNSPPSLLLGSNLSVNALLLKALQLRSSGYQPIDLFQINSDYNNFMSQGVSQFGNDFSSNLSASSSTKVLDSMPHQQPQEPPFNLDSAW